MKIGDDMVDKNNLMLAGVHPSLTRDDCESLRFPGSFYVTPMGVSWQCAIVVHFPTNIACPKIVIICKVFRHQRERI